MQGIKLLTIIFREYAIFNHGYVMKLKYYRNS